METNYALIVLVGIVVIVLIVWVLRKNHRDKKKLERNLNASEMKPEKHKDGEV